MPNDALIAAIESLRDTYSQRQRAATSLQTALKGTTGALGKASRSLFDYTTQGTSLDSAKVAQAQQTFNALRLKDDAVDPLLPDLRREVKTLGHVVTVLRDALTALREESVDAVKLGHAFAALQAARMPDAALDELLPRLGQELRRTHEALGSTFGQAVRHALAEQGIEAGGRIPHIEIGRFDIEADFSTRSATISYGKHLVNKRVPLSVDAVIKAYQREVKAVTGRNQDGKAWIETFYTAWDTARLKRNTTDQRANIADCYYEMALLRQSKAFRIEPTKSRITDYTRAQFAYDFFEFTDQQRRDYKGQRVFSHVATKWQIESAERCVWIVEGKNPHDGRYIGDVVFSKDE